MFQAMFNQLVRVQALMSSGQDFLAKAAKKESASGGFGSFFGGGSSSKYEEARELYLSASNALQVSVSAAVGSLLNYGRYPL